MDPFMSDDTLVRMKEDYLHFTRPTWREGVDLIDEVLRLRKELSRYKTPQVENATFHMQGQIFNPKTMKWDVIT